MYIFALARLTLVDIPEEYGGPINLERSYTKTSKEQDPSWRFFQGRLQQSIIKKPQNLLHSNLSSRFQM